MPKMMALNDVIVWDRGPLCYRAYSDAYNAENRFTAHLHELLPRPDLTILLDVDVDIASQRIKARRSKAAKSDEAPDFLTRVRESYLRLAKATKDVAIIDGRGNIRQVEGHIIRAVDTFL
jgi:dTMP kinase